MVLTTLTFLVFVLITLLIYFVIPKKYKWLVLLVSSIYFLFYNNFSFKIVLYILIILLTSYLGGLLISKYKDSFKSKWVLLICIIIILGILIYLKYTNFLLLTLQYIIRFFGGNFTFNYVYRDFPIGLSYYSLFMIGYLVDVYRGICIPQKNILKCALFMSYFPVLTSGPFIRYNDEQDYLYNGHKINLKEIYLGIVRILWGLFKVLVISERLNIIVNTIYGDISTYSGLYILLAILCFPIQLYTNFSGSIDIVIGVSKMFGIYLPENFTSPFFSKTITELWRNWHITLGAFLRDYIFYPLMKSNIIQKIGAFFKNKFGKKVSKKVTLYISMFIMWVLIGIWHNGSYNFIISSGILQFIYMVLEDLLGPLVHKINVKLHINDQSKKYKIYQIIRTYLLFALAMIFFRASSVTNGISIIKSLFISTTFSLRNLGLNNFNYIILLISLLILFIVDKINKNTNILEKVNSFSTINKIILIGIFILIILTFGMYGIGFNVSDFIYSKF